ncbi:MAG: metalloregulator ArsR/SmtB family transcription factor [Oscillospiraceae bacterium]|nr:metalloregulator ArsR/SmtB family transcription factor [Oscillospiraceae bacterium]
MEERAKHIAQLLKVLANENRLLILCALMESEKTVGELAKCVPSISQSALSQHLSLLKTAAILDFQKNGQTITYCISDHRIEEIIEVLKRQYCV